MEVKKVGVEVEKDKDVFELRDKHSRCILSANKDSQEIIIWVDAIICLNEEDFLREKNKHPNQWVLFKPLAVFRKKSSWQKYDCIACSKKATLEVVFGNARIRCCNNERCKIQAEKLARISGYGKEQKRLMLKSP